MSTNLNDARFGNTVGQPRAPPLPRAASAESNPRAPPHPPRERVLGRVRFLPMVQPRVPWRRRTAPLIDEREESWEEEAAIRGILRGGRRKKKTKRRRYKIKKTRNKRKRRKGAKSRKGKPRKK